ncbi:MAG: hypothetical protein MH252_07275 [Thermosynechococcaceae cyanobacterium MS004]|nr:hypothetical protein [Thermosynechococcaceae cyanobacterium MS004]
MSKSKLHLVAAITTAVISIHISKTLAASITNGSFEDGLTGWTVISEPGGAGSWYSTSETFVGSPIEGSTDGSFYAFTTQRGPSSQILFQDITVDSIGKQTLSFDWFTRSGGELASNGTESYLGGPNQHFRVDLLTLEFNDFFGPSENGVIANLISDTADFRVGSFTSEFQSTVFDLTPFSGQTIRLAFRQVDNQFPLSAAVDDVRITSIKPVHVPESSIVGAISSVIATITILTIKLRQKEYFP